MPTITMGVLVGVSIFWAGVLTYHELRGRSREQEKKLHDKRERRAKREALANFLNEGQALKRRCEDEGQLPPEETSNEWMRITESWLDKELDASYVTRFRNTADVPLTTNTIASIPHRNLWAGIHTRCYQLGKFIEQLGD